MRPTDEDEGIWLDNVEVHLVTHHSVGQVKEMHVHDPPQDHIIVMRSGRMRWTVEDQTLDAGLETSSSPLRVPLTATRSWAASPRASRAWIPRCGRWPTRSGVTPPRRFRNEGRS
jgi:hypothetical protein